MKGFWDEASGLKFIQVEPDAEIADLPTIICLHGRGADPNDLAGLAGELYPEGYRWLLPQGPLEVPLGFNMTGWAWYSLGEERPGTVVEAREQVRRFIGDACDRLGTDAGRIAVMGFSQGGAMSLHVAVTSSVTFGAVVAMSGYLPAVETLPQGPAAAAQTILMVHGTQDQTLDVGLARQARELLTQAGLPPRYQEFEMGHSITRESLAAVRDFLGEVFPPAAPAAS